jgi:superfamily II DNA helicase RecQ
VEVAPSRRGDLCGELLGKEDRLPAIVYTPSRREAESVAVLLSERFRASAYHAGLDAQRRSEVQSKFLGGQLDVIVATIAFGMGIDKANIRTVIHTATPGSMEAYYQEIGRAGRDGQPSRVILMQSYADRRTHDFFFERDYPMPAALSAIYAKLSDEPMPKEALRIRCKLGEEFDAALEKLWTHAGAIVDFEENVSRGEPTWRAGYEAQRDQKAEQLEEMLRFADSSQCRMATLVRHFGDLRDGKTNCGICDFCAPDDCMTQLFREPTPSERKVAGQILGSLVKAGTLAAGRLHTEVGGEGAMVRRDFEHLLGGLARAKLVRLEDASFEKDGKSISFRKVHITLDGRAEAKSGEPTFAITEIVEAESRSRKKKGKPAAKKKKETRAPQPPTQEVDGLTKALRAWRLDEARRQGVPAFRVMTDQTLRAIVEERPQTTAALLAIHGMGLRGVEKYGAAIFRVLRKSN